MIAVIADDFTGAAEIGGVGLQHGMKVLIETEVSGKGNPDLLVIVADSRTNDQDKAVAKIRRITSDLMKLNPRFIYKKLDSVLRGNVYAELVAQQEESGKDRVLIVPANPHFNRIVRNGVYYVNDVPLAETSFAGDPEFPVHCSEVSEIIGEASDEVTSVHFDGELPERGFLVGDVESEAGMSEWASLIDKQTVYGGGSGFFKAILDREFPLTKAGGQVELTEKRRSLFVFGSTFPKSAEFISRLETTGAMFINLSENYFESIGTSDEMTDELASDVVSWIEQDRKVILTTIFAGTTTAIIHPEEVRSEIGKLVKKVFSLARIDDLYIEGGATASEIFRYLNITQLIPVKELDYGIIQMQVEAFPGLNLITKPGSYNWPASVIDTSHKYKST